MRLRRGDVIIFKRKSLPSLIVKLFTKSDYTHCAVYLRGGEVIEADWGGVKVSKLREKYKKVDYDVFRYEERDRKKVTEKATNWMLKQIGKGYDWMGIIGIGLNILGIKKSNDFDDKKRFWCSEIITDAFIQASVVLYPDPTTSHVSPKDLANSKFLNKK